MGNGVHTLTKCGQRVGDPIADRNLTVVGYLSWLATIDVFMPLDALNQA